MGSSCVVPQKEGGESLNNAKLMTMSEIKYVLEKHERESKKIFSTNLKKSQIK